MAVEKAIISMAVHILGSFFGCIRNKVHDWATDKLKDGDLANEDLRQVLVRDLNEINMKLDSLSLKDLNASCSFLKEGVLFLIIALDKPSEDQETREGPDEGPTGISTDGATGSLNVVLKLPQTIQNLQISSQKRLEEAKKSFQKAREDATHAFSNKSLSVKDRIMACNIRVAARIFESGLEDPEAAVSACLLTLKELHGLQAIEEMFKVFLSGGWWSWLSKAERLENIMSVLFINHVLFDFATKCNSKHPNVFTWPIIELADRAFHPILHTYDIVAKTSSSEEFGQQLNRMIVDKRISGDGMWCFAVNSRGDIIVVDNNTITVVYSSGESKDVTFTGTSGGMPLGRTREAVAVDSDDNVYVVRSSMASNDNRTKTNFELNVLDKNYDIKHDFILLDFVHGGTLTGMKIAVDKSKNIIMITSENNQVYVCDNAGKLKFKFERDGRDLWLSWGIGISDQNDIMIPSCDRKGVHVYTAEGKLKSTIKLPEDHKVWKVAFHHGIGKIIFLIFDAKQDCFSLLCYSETGKLENSARDMLWWSKIACHSSGTFAILQGRSVTFI